MKFISHLDLMRLLTRALRRANFALKLTEGFSPRPKLSIKRALRLGIESDNEEASVILREPVSPQEFKDRLESQFPEGIRINSVNTASIG